MKNEPDVRTLARRYRVAFLTLRAFRDNASYGDYAEHDQWTDEEYRQTLEQIESEYRFYLDQWRRVFPADAKEILIRLKEIN